jgi:hypothetical protein
MNCRIRFAIFVIVLFSASIAMALDESQLPENWWRLIGQWQTPRGSLLTITGENPGTFKGYLTEVSSSASAAGFKKDELVLDAGEMVGDQIFFRVAVRPEDASLQSCPTRYQEFKGVLSDGKIAGKIRAARFDKCELMLLDGFETLEYAQLPVECMELPDHEIFDIRRAGSITHLKFEASSENPLGQEDAYFSVRLLSAGQPFKEVLIHWEIEDTSGGGGAKPPGLPIPLKTELPGWDLSCYRTGDLHRATKSSSGPKNLSNPAVIGSRLRHPIWI